MSSPARKRKFALLGARGVGKTALTTAFCAGTFETGYVPTIELRRATRERSCMEIRSTPARSSIQLVRTNTLFWGQISRSVSTDTLSFIPFVT
mmetsp:Transcript_3236/g.6089  ORF Transcript_3236/g.6089 Transcript_3236/m.6089 type:complete len:93 (+) Transcript_3236:178-456(+)